MLSTVAATGLSSLSATEAVAMQRQAVSMAPSDSGMQARLGERLLAVPGHEREAEAALRESLRWDPRDGHTLNVIGTLLQSQQGRWR